MSPNRRIFLNIAATYGRSLYALVCGLFISRWVLAALGKTDFGLCGVVSGMMVIDKVGSAFIRRILLRMKQLGVSQTELAKRMQVSRPYITKVLRQDVNITFRTAAKLAIALKMDFFPDLRPQEVTQKLPNMV